MSGMAERKTHWSEFDKSGMTSVQRDVLVVKLRQQGYSIRQIAAHVGMSAAGIRHALERIEEGRAGRDPRH